MLQDCSQIRACFFVILSHFELLSLGKVHASASAQQLHAGKAMS